MWDRPHTVFSHTQPSFEITARQTCLQGCMKLALIRTLHRTNSWGIPIESTCIMIYLFLSSIPDWDLNSLPAAKVLWTRFYHVWLKK